MARVTYRPGETALVKGIYQCDFCNDYGRVIQITIEEGKKFPKCRACGGNAHWYKIVEDVWEGVTRDTVVYE